MNSFVNSPVVVALIGAACTALVTLAVAGVRIVIQIAQLQTEIKSLHQDISDMKNDPDVMRWSNYGRAQQAFQQGSSMHGGQSS